MSRVTLITADKELPLCSCQEIRTSTVMIEGTEYTISVPGGFMVGEHSYYRSCVDEMGYSMKPYQYELCMEQHETDLQNFRSYLQAHFAPGEEVELWNLWIGIDQSGCLSHYRGTLADFDLDTLGQFDYPLNRDGLPGQCRMTITI